MMLDLFRGKLEHYNSFNFVTMDIKDLKIGDVISISPTYGEVMDKNNPIIELTFSVAEIKKLENDSRLICLTNSPSEVWVKDSYIHGIPISDLLLKKLGWHEIEKDMLNHPQANKSSIEKGFSNSHLQLFKDYDNKYYFIRSRSTNIEEIKYIHELQRHGIKINPTEIL